MGKKTEASSSRRLCVRFRRPRIWSTPIERSDIAPERREGEDPDDRS